MNQAPSDNQRMILRTTETSPYGRKARMAMLNHNLQDRVDIVPANTLDETDNLREQNPLGKIPCLVLPDSRVLFDSRVIVEYFDSLGSGAPLVPASGADRFDVLTRTVLCDGLTDAALLMVYEGRFRDADKHSARWLDHQRGKAMRALNAISIAPPPSQHTDMSSLALACALGYLDWRQPIPWRHDYPGLVDWLNHFTDNQPAVLATAA